MTKTVVARFNFSEVAASAATLMTAGAADGATFTAEHDVATDTFVVVRNDAAAETPYTIEDFVAALQAKSDAYYEVNFPTLQKPVFGASNPGKVYQRVYVDSYGQRSVHCFVDKAGHVFKAAGWPAPAKGARYATMQAAVEAFNGSGTGYLYVK